MGVEVKLNDNLTLVDYINSNLETFEEDPFNDADALAFAQFVYLNFHEDNDIAYRRKGIEIKDIYKAEHFEELFDQSWKTEEFKYFFSAMSASPRFRNLVLRYYRNELDKSINLQFGAITISLSEKLHVIVYRGTDFSFAGWKEDALLALDKPIASQKLAAAYLEEVAKKIHGRFIIVGHSKGGNLAVYAAANCNQKVQERIESVYSFDGPGFYESELLKDGYQRIKDRCKKFIPTFSVFGTLFDSIVEPVIVHSYDFGLMQHHAFSWGIERRTFIKEKETEPISSLIHSRLNNWLSTLNEDQKRVFVQGLFDLLDSMKVESIDSLATDAKKIWPEVSKCINEMEPRRKKFMQYAFALMISGRGDMKKLKDIQDLKGYEFGESLETEKFEDNFALFI